MTYRLKARSHTFVKNQKSAKEVEMNSIDGCIEWYRISMFYKEIKLHLEADHEQKMIWIHFHTMTYCWCCQSCWLENDPNPRPHHHFFEPQINCFAAQLAGWWRRLWRQRRKKIVAIHEIGR